ncbi:MAG: hypothetical protein WCL34_09945 [Methylococcaceae bacterium]
MAIKLITTVLTSIIDNRIALLLTPIGDIPRNQALVYSSMNEVADLYDGVSVVSENGIFYAQFDCDVSGEGVVSYITDGI